MFIAWNAAMPAPTKTTNPISTSERRARQNPIRPRSMGDGRPSLHFVVDKDSTSSDNTLARIQARDDLYKAVGFTAEHDFASLEHPRLALDPDARGLALPDHA